jgi:hypothetical protein
MNAVDFAFDFFPYFNEYESIILKELFKIGKLGEDVFKIIVNLKIKLF